MLKLTANIYGYRCVYKNAYGCVHRHMGTDMGTSKVADVSILVDMRVAYGLGIGIGIGNGLAIGIDMGMSIGKDKFRRTCTRMFPGIGTITNL